MERPEGEKLAHGNRRDGIDRRWKADRGPRSGRGMTLSLDTQPRAGVRGKTRKIAGDEAAARGTTAEAASIVLTEAERAGLRRAGTVLCVSDLIWIAQAALLAFSLSHLLSATLSHTGVDSSAYVDLTALLMAAAGFGVLALLRAGLQFDANRRAGDIARQAKARVRTELLAHVSSLSPSAPLPSSGTVGIYVSEQVDALGPYIRHYQLQATRVRIVPVLMAAAVLPFSWMAAIILLVCGPVIPVFMALIGMRAKSASENQQEHLARLGGLLLDRVRGLETLRAYGALGRTLADVKRSGEAFRAGTMRVLKIAFLSSTVLELFSALGIAFVAVYVGFSLLGEISVGTWAGPLGYFSGLFVLLIAPEFFAPLRAFATAYHDRAAGLAAQEKLHELLAPSQDGGQSQVEAGKQVANVRAACPVPAGPPAISLASVSLVLGNRPILNTVSLEIHPGATVVLTGGSGTGKTTLLDCLLGLQQVDQGLIRIAGRNVADLDGVAWRSSIAWLGQAPRLFHGSLKANLRMAAPEATEAQIHTALALAGAQDLVPRLPRGLETQLGEDGFGLSVGEIRRVALARAALRADAPVFLADEPTAGLDSDTAKDVIDGLKRLGAGKTAVFATHDPSLLALADLHLELADGALRTARPVGATS